MKRKTQKERLVEALKKDWLSTYDACVRKLTTKLPSRCGELSKEYTIAKRWVTPKKVKAHYLYKIVGN